MSVVAAIEVQVALDDDDDLPQLQPLQLPPHSPVQIVKQID